jgi:hypothetical protein
MKKIIPVVFLWVALAITGCKKNYTCTCAWTIPNPPPSYQVQHTNYTINNATNSEAQSDCTGYGATIKRQNGGGNADCYLQ